MRLVKLDYERSCSSNVSKFGKHHPETKYVSGRLASKKLQDITGGRWTAKIKLNRAGEAGMFPAWGILGARNNEPPILEDDEKICWPLPGSGEIDILEHHGTYGGQTGYVGRSILPLGKCDDGGDWWTNQVNLLSNLTIDNSTPGEFVIDVTPTLSSGVVSTSSVDNLKTIMSNIGVLPPEDYSTNSGSDIRVDI